MVWVVFDLLAHGVWQLQFLHNHLHHDTQSRLIITHLSGRVAERQNVIRQVVHLVD